VIVPEETVTVPPDVIVVVPRTMSVPDVPTVRPVTMGVPALLRSSAAAAVPDAEAVALNGVPDSVRTAPDTVPGVVPSVMVARTVPIADVPMTSEPAEAVPVEAAATLDAIRSATNCIRLVLSVVA